MAPQVTLTGTFEDILGNPVTTGTVTAVLMGYGANIPRVAGVAIFDGISASATVSGSGTFTLGPLYGNDVITPGPLTTYYQITMPAPNGGTVTKSYQFSGSGSFDLSQLVPMGTPLRGDNTLANAAIPQVFSPVSHQFLTGMNSLGHFTAAQPKGADLSDVALGSTTPVTWNGDTGLSRDAAGVVDVGNGTQGDASGKLRLVNIDLLNNGSLLRFGALADTGFSRDSAGVIDVGNGSQGDKSGTVQAASLIASSTLQGPIKNSSLVSAGNGNTVTLLNSQGPAAALTGNSTDQTVFTYSIPANTIAAGKGFRVHATWVHSSGTPASITYKFILGSTTLATFVESVVNTDQAVLEVFNAAGVQNSQFCRAMAWSNLSVINSSTNGATENLALASTIKLTFNVSNTDQIAPKFWLVELIQ